MKSDLNNSDIDRDRETDIQRYRAPLRLEPKKTRKSEIAIVSRLKYMSNPKTRQKLMLTDQELEPAHHKLEPFHL